MRDWLWYISLALESAVLGVLMWKRELPWLCCWLAFDILTGGINVWAHLAYPAGGRYQISWTIKQPGVIVTRVLAARECWQRLSGRTWTAVSISLSVAIYETIWRRLPMTVLDIEFAILGITSAALAFIVLRSLLAAKKLTADPFILRHAHVLIGYLLMEGLIYYVTPAYRESIGVGTGIVACLAYGSWLAISIRKHQVAATTTGRI